MRRRPHANARTRGRLWCALGIAFGLSGGTSVPAASAAAEPSQAAEPAVDPSDSTDPPATVESDTVDAPKVVVPVDEASTAGPKVDDGILPCGLRVIIAQDRSLPVAAVVLSIDTGTEDDPSDQPGLVHALAYQLLQGNRELPPGGAAALVQDRGGFASLAVGPAQVRYESLAPISALGDVLWAESQRLRAPTVSAELWRSSLRWARRDKERVWRVPREAMAAAHGVEGLAHSGRTVSPPLQSMVPRAVANALANRFRYDLATLVIVSPQPPAELRESVEGLFADLPEHAHTARDRQPRWRSGTVPQSIAVAGEKGERYVWPVGPDPASVGLATVWCKAINRQRRVPGEAARARLRCHLDVDPRRATLVLVATGVEHPDDLVRGRIERLENGTDNRLIERQRQVVAQQWALSLRSALPLAQTLATSAAASEPSRSTAWLSRPLRWLTGQAAVEAEWEPGATFGPHLQLGAAIRLAPAPAAAKEGEP